MVRPATCLLTVVLAGHASAASGQTMPSNEYEMDVLRLLNETWRDTLYPEYAFAQPEILGSADDLQLRSHEVMLQGGGHYLIAVVCDEDCSDIDIRAYTEGGAEAAYDEAGARRRYGFAAITLSPLLSETYRFEIDMYSCTNEPCYYAVGVFVVDESDMAPAPAPASVTPDHTVPALQ